MPHLELRPHYPLSLPLAHDNSKQSNKTMPSFRKVKANWLVFLYKHNKMEMNESQRVVHMNSHGLWLKVHIFSLPMRWTFISVISYGMNVYATRLGVCVHVYL